MAPRGEDAVSDPDLALVRRIAAGDGAASAALVDRHLPKMTRLAFRMLGDRHEAEDVAQEVFLRVWRTAEKWRPGAAKFETWMHRVAINLCYDRLRRRRETPMETPPEQIDSRAPDAEMLKTQAARAVKSALETLPERQRAALILSYYEEKTNIEGAQIMNVSIDAFESLLARGRRGLHARLEAQRDALTGGMSHG